MRALRPDAGERRLNEQFHEGPSNHRYRILGGKLIPGFQLYERWQTLAPVWSEPPETFIDIGCCYGYYVLQTAQRAGCRLAVGVDVHEPFVATAAGAGRLLQLPNVAFYRAVLDDLARRPAHYGGPFQAAFLLGTYHYLFWGSSRSGHSFRSHETIFSLLSRLVTGSIVFSARLELNHLPAGVRQRARFAPEAGAYNTASFLRAAEPFFDVEQAGFLGCYPLLVMRKRVSTPAERKGGVAAERQKPSPVPIATASAKKKILRERLREASGRSAERPESSAP